MVTAAACLAALRSPFIRSNQGRLFLVWMAYCGFYMALPQFVIGTVSLSSDVDRATSYLHLGAGDELVIALPAMLAIPVVTRPLARYFLESMDCDAGGLPGGRQRVQQMFVCGTLPVLVGTVLIIPPGDGRGDTVTCHRGDRRTRLGAGVGLAPGRCCCKGVFRQVVHCPAAGRGDHAVTVVSACP